MIYLFTCKPHACDRNQTNIFLYSDRKQFRAVIRVDGAQTLLGGAGPQEVACVKKLDGSGGVASAC